MTPEDKKALVVIGTSGSTDYLRDATGNQRFWLVKPPPEATAAAETCDGIHDEGAPAQYLCSRCFPDRNDLGQAEDDEYDEHPCNEEEEID
jgi:hypothetical protein